MFLQTNEIHIYLETTVSSEVSNDQPTLTASSSNPLTRILANNLTCQSTAPFHKVVNFLYTLFREYVGNLTFLVHFSPTF